MTTHFKVTTHISIEDNIFGKNLTLSYVRDFCFLLKSRT